MSVCNILALDQVKQEACLKEKLAKICQLLQPSYVSGIVTKMKI